jgi:hypothetical protein
MSYLTGTCIVAFFAVLLVLLVKKAEARTRPGSAIQAAIDKAVGESGLRKGLPGFKSIGAMWAFLSTPEGWADCQAEIDYLVQHGDVSGVDHLLKYVHYDWQFQVPFDFDRFRIPLRYSLENLSLGQFLQQLDEALELYKREKQARYEALRQLDLEKKEAERVRKASLTTLEWAREHSQEMRDVRI